jgi:drug/metabolite transporter (DMT)-like permease
MTAGTERLAMLAAATTGFQVGAAMVATRFVVDQTGPASLALMRYAVGALFLMVPLLATGGRMRFARRDILPIAALGVGQFAVLVVLLNAGLRSVSSARAAVIFATMPLLTLVIAALMGRERLSASKVAGVALTIVAVGLVFGDKLFAATRADELVGAALVLASALCGAVCSVLYRPYLRRYPTLPVSAFAMLASVVALALAAAVEGSFDSWPAITPAGWGAVVFIGLSSGVGYVCWLWALTHASPTRVTVFLALSPITAALLGAVLLGERPSLLLGGAILAVMLGLWLAYRDPGET